MQEAGAEDIISEQEQGGMDRSRTTVKCVGIVGKKSLFGIFGRQSESYPFGDGMPSEVL